MTNKQLTRYVHANHLERVVEVAERIATFLADLAAEIRRPPRRAWMIVEGRGFVPR